MAWKSSGVVAGGAGWGRDGARCTVSRSFRHLLAWALECRPTLIDVLGVTRSPTRAVVWYMRALVVVGEREKCDEAQRPKLGEIVSDTRLAGHARLHECRPGQECESC